MRLLRARDVEDVAHERRQVVGQGGAADRRAGERARRVRLVVVDDVVEDVDERERPPAEARQARRAQDGRAEPTLLAERFAGRVSPTDAAGFASLFPLVVECADADDSAALALFCSAASELAQTAAAALRALELIDTPLPLGVTGGAFSGSPVLKSKFVASLREVAPHATPTALEVPPEIAVLRLLRSADGASP